jgi:hypothetical protein
MKPHGLWLSVESDWRDWCEHNDFHLEALTHRTEVALRPAVNVLRLATTSELRAFSRRYECMWQGLSLPDWVAVTRDYGGLIIAPYVLESRLELLWYYGWDCASGCIWDCSTLDVVTSRR